MNIPTTYLEAMYFNHTYVSWDAITCMYLHHVPHTKVLCADGEFFSFTPHNGLLTGTQAWWKYMVIFFRLWKETNQTVLNRKRKKLPRIMMCLLEGSEQYKGNDNKKHKSIYCGTKNILHLPNLIIQNKITIIKLYWCPISFTSPPPNKHNKIHTTKSTGAAILPTLEERVDIWWTSGWWAMKWTKKFIKQRKSTRTEDWVQISSVC